MFEILCVDSLQVFPLISQNSFLSQFSPQETFHLLVFIFSNSLTLSRIGNFSSSDPHATEFHDGCQQTQRDGTVFRQRKKKLVWLFLTSSSTRKIWFFTINKKRLRLALRKTDPKGFFFAVKDGKESEVVGCSG